MFASYQTQRKRKHNKAYGKLFIDLLAFADPDIRQRGYHINPGIRLVIGNLICFPVSHVNFFEGESKVYSQTEMGPRPDLLLWIRHCLLMHNSILKYQQD